ncbi:MAG: hypothetical protein ABI402_21090 [Ferruginibacter sp.]
MSQLQMQHHPDINKSLSDLPFSDHFKKTATALNFKTLAEILKYDSAALTRLPGFNYHFLQEFISYIENKGLADLLKE